MRFQEKERETQNFEFNEDPANFRMQRTECWHSIDALVSNCRASRKYGKLPNGTGRECEFKSIQIDDLKADCKDRGRRADDENRFGTSDPVH